MMNFSNVSCLSSLIVVFCGLWSFIFYHKHLLSSLLSLKFMMLGVFCLLITQLSGVGEEVYFSLLLLTLAACEGTLGLFLLILVVRAHGNYIFSSFNTLAC